MPLWGAACRPPGGPATGTAFARIEVPLSGSAVAARGLLAGADQAEAAKLAGAQGQKVVLGANYPNPFNAQTVIQYQLAETGSVRLEVYDFLGQRVRTLVAGEQAVGVYLVVWTAGMTRDRSWPQGCISAASKPGSSLRCAG